MNTIAILHADIERSPIGTPSRLTESLAGVPVLTRTVRRVLGAKAIEGVVVTTPSAHHDQVTALVQAAAANGDRGRVLVRTFDGPAAAGSATVRAARKWSLHSWRGGLGNTCFFDEHTHPALWLAVAEQGGADLVASVPAEAPLLDPATLDAMVTHFRDAQDDEVRMVFAQAPPGLVPALFTVGLLRDRRVPIASKAIALAGIGYVVSPLDAIPALIFGPIGLVDDLVVVAASLSTILNRIHPDVVRSHWSGQGDALDAVQAVTGWVETEIVGGLSSVIGRLGRVGRR